MPLESWKKHYWYTVPCMRGRIEEIIKMADGAGKKVLEIGCHEGFVSKALQEAGCEVTSADYDQANLDKAREIFGINGVRADVNDLPFPDEYFDIVVSGETLEHVYNPFHALSELFRVAKEKVIITIPIGEYWLGELTHQWELKGEFVDHDTAQVVDMPKNILILCWTRRRDRNFKDIPPFNTEEHKKKYEIR